MRVTCSALSVERSAFSVFNDKWHGEPHTFGVSLILSILYLF
uniref:Uncharacterized protein n=1 Tax=Anguilla anguilla TaxID=7936 RepID=A0A0E9RXP8_ANGAN